VTVTHRNSSRSRLVGVLGGTFDPVHIGHLRTALELLERAGLREIRLIPAARPPHRAAPGTSAALRLAMLEAAIADEPRFVADRRELDRTGPSYTVLTLESLAAEQPDAIWCLLLGMDAFLGLPEWHRWTDLLELAHVVVAHRPGARVPDGGQLGKLVRERRTASAADLTAARAGRIHIEPVTQLDISASGIRAAVRAGRDPRYLVPDAVRRIIFETECYAEKQTEDAQG
jgi:nicotinate-nucleotide adenylyltransferase